jgi:glycosyltransferase involved in cell wall biosynthesis
MTTFHGIYGLESGLKKRYNSVMVKGERVIAVSNFVRDHILSEYKIDPVKVRTIPRGVDFNLFDESRILPGRIEQLSRHWQVEDNFLPILFCPGRISRIKGQHVLIEALAQLNDLQFLCIIAGTDKGHEDYREELEELIRAKNLVGKVRIADSTNFMAEAYTLSSLVVVPSTQPESFGRVAIEAQAMGKLVIATDHGGARETIVPNETGYLVPPGNPTMMAEAIRFGLNRDERVVMAMADFARQHVRRHFSSAEMKAKTIDVYRELLT